MLYRKLYDYIGKVTYVLGEFYWQVARDERTANSDYVGTGAAAAKRLNREQTAGRGQRRRSSGRPARRSPPTRCWTPSGSPPSKRAALQRDALPTTFKGSLLAKIFFWIFIVARGADAVPLRQRRRRAAIAARLRNTFGDASQEYQNCLNSQRSGSGYRSGGGSFGGFSSGGGHK